MADPHRILFVCHGNIFRSVLGERACQQVLNRIDPDKQFAAFSRGLQGMPGVDPPQHRHARDYDMWPIAEPHLTAAGLSFDGHVATPATAQDVAESSVIIAMDQLVLDGYPYSLAARFPSHRSRMHLFTEIAGGNADVIDPHGVMDGETYRLMIANVQAILNDHIQSLLSWSV